MTQTEKRRPGQGGAPTSRAAKSAPEYSETVAPARTLSLIWDRDRDQEPWRRIVQRHPEPCPSLPRGKWVWSGNVAFIRPSGVGYRIVECANGWQVGVWYPRAYGRDRFAAWHDGGYPFEVAATTLTHIMRDRPRPIYPPLRLQRRQRRGVAA